MFENVLGYVFIGTIAVLLAAVLIIPLALEIKNTVRSFKSRSQR